LYLDRLNALDNFGCGNVKPEYREGPEARKKFDEGMAKLFRAPKSKVTEEKPKPKPTRKKASKG
jgi:hypothetical protein